MIIGSREACFPEDMEFRSLICQKAGPVLSEASGIRDASPCGQMYSGAFGSHEMDIQSTTGQRRGKGLPLPAQWERSQIVVDQCGATVGAMGARQPKVTTVPYSVHLSAQSRRPGAVTMNPSAPGSLGRGLLVGGVGELGRMDTAAVPTPLTRPCLGGAAIAHPCPCGGPHHFWAQCQPDIHQPSL